MMKYISNLSFGLGSFCATKRIIEEVGVDNVVCVFADTNWEDEDTYKWGRAAVKVLGCECVELKDGRCVKQGQSGWALLYKTMPERFLEVMKNEEDMRKHLGKDVTMLKETVKGKRINLPLTELKRRLDFKEAMPLFDYGACSCFAGDD